MASAIANLHNPPEPGDQDRCSAGGLPRTGQTHMVFDRDRNRIALFPGRFDFDSDPDLDFTNGFIWFL
jgi:hypothetical protein